MIARIVRSTGAALAVALALAAYAAPNPTTPTPTTTDEARRLYAMLPHTVEDHAAMARSYEEKVAAWRKEAELHREMAAAYSKSHPDFKGGVRNTEAVKMEKHCMAIVKDAEKLAADGEWSARYHRERAKELERQAK
jgi:hypothetical protein